MFTYRPGPSTAVHNNDRDVPLMRPDFEFDDDMIAIVQLVREGGHTSIRIDEACPDGIQWAFLAQQCRDVAERLDQRQRDGHGGLIRFDLDDDDIKRLLG